VTLSLLRTRFRFPPLLIAHLLATAAAASLFAWAFNQSARVIASHVLLLAEWDVMLASLLAASLAFARGGARWPWTLYCLLLAATCTLQIDLYALNVVSNLAWGRNMNGHLVMAFAPTVWSGREPFPLGSRGITAFVLITLAVMLALTFWRARQREERFLAAWAAARARLTLLYRFPRALALLAIATMLAACVGTALHGVADRDNLFWKQELLTSFFRPEGFAFEPTARRLAVAERDAVLRASYPRSVATAHRKHVVLIIVDSLRADRMHVYGYARPTTPFLSRLVEGGRASKVETAFSTCSESFCGITSTLTGREFRDISARTFQLQDVLRDEGYQTWFLLSGNHRAWNGLPYFYHADEGTLFDGTQTVRYSMDDDRLLLEGLERVPAASPQRPSFFYFHLMSTHYLGVQFAESHVFTRPDDNVSPGLEPYKILDQLNKPDRYDDKVRQADGIIRQLFEALKAKHYLDDAVVIVTADHGEGLGERHWAHGWNLYDEDIRIPLLIYDAPPVRYPDLSFATQIDIAPTILDRLGLPIPSSWEGQSLLSPSTTRTTCHQTYFVPHRFAIVYRRPGSLFKFIATPQYGKEELYDLLHDRGEVHNLVTEQPALVSMLREKARACRGDEE
jgi:glucan phosphoethanolaminetransferase (alkaline phosphatase superfamily)